MRLSRSGLGAVTPGRHVDLTHVDAEGTCDLLDAAPGVQGLAQGGDAGLLRLERERAPGRRVRRAQRVEGGEPPGTRFLGPVHATLLHRARAPAVGRWCCLGLPGRDLERLRSTSWAV